MIIAVGSKNKTKIDPVRDVFSRHFKDIEVIGVAVESGVKEQPLSDEETFTGAHNRAKNAIKTVPGAAFGVGIEGGLHKHKFGWMERSFVVIVDKYGNAGIGSSGGVVLPEKVMQFIHDGKDLEHAIDTLFGTEKIGSGIGMFGIFTKGVVTRTSGVQHGVAFALSRFLHPDIYENDTSVT